MKVFINQLSIISGVCFFLTSCSSSTESEYQSVTTEEYPNVEATFGTKIDLANLYNYANQTIPNYITKDNSLQIQ